MRHTSKGPSLLKNSEATTQRSNAASIIRVLFADPDESLLAIYREPLPDDFEVRTAANQSECIGRPSRLSVVARSIGDEGSLCGPASQTKAQYGGNR